ncbi:hypothetical protein BAUCODRAFT_317737 [Baudoinia panamericana UAMH 10762]|uniref:Uncharacterized protein n=1 Tax=Baudoinia panamericana (strain UAMH 10762) TaxID=717646 RepID=M2MIU1_BAUPA|nr:uncharacterized protein BAUCODRAFT_317737 [Baudoinia panamericana UAMH 10762]EMC91188.1 hypothetical protein BAUCODRAFT_317737 [Baudoinia panamericana UAMH 10762]
MAFKSRLPCVAGLLVESASCEPSYLLSYNEVDESLIWQWLETDLEHLLGDRKSDMMLRLMVLRSLLGVKLQRAVGGPADNALPCILEAAKLKISAQLKAFRCISLRSLIVVVANRVCCPTVTLFPGTDTSLWSRIESLTASYFLSQCSWNYYGGLRGSE